MKGEGRGLGMRDEGGGSRERVGGVGRKCKDGEVVEKMEFRSGWMVWVVRGG